MANYYFRSYGSGFGGFSLFTPVIKALLISNIVVFIAQYLFLGLLTIGGVSVQRLLIAYFALQPLESGSFFPWQLLSYQFMHGGLLHLFFNMLALWIFGLELESLWGSRRFLVFYLLAGVGAGLTQLLVSSLLPGYGGPTVGASGAIQGVMIAFGFMFPDRPILMFPIFFPIPAKIFVFMWIGIDLIAGLMGNDSVAHFAHLGGALTGYILLRFGDQIGVFDFFSRLRKMLSDSRRIFGKQRKIYDIREVSTHSNTQSRIVSTWFRARVSHDGSRVITQEEIDAILDKIAKTGYSSLSEEEKRILMEASKKL
ncbi:MAG: rhomboid family intramembrane serine protease [Bacteroidota bacterium]|nr:rhomboid family intramembrane serine protease [Candidatus Kapabacteria bacterium]MDW8221010.1 rhomboid family intramembrane serine protease [Bacteroidota bacterium]